MTYPSVFRPLKIGALEIKNRIAMMPMGVFSPRLFDPKTAAYTKDGADYYIERAKGGAGLLISGLVSIVENPTPTFFQTPVDHPREFVEQSRYLMDGVHKYGCKIFIQLTAMHGRAAHGESEEALYYSPAPSEIQNVWDPTIKNRAITKEEIHRYIENFAAAAAIVKEAGGDGVEIHATHEGYLLDQFAIAYMNHRTDEYGGSLENRMRFATEIVRAIKTRCGEDFPVSMRFSVRSYLKGFNRGALPGEDFEEKGRDLEEAKKVARILQDAGYDMLNCDNGTYDSWFWAHPPMYMPKACNLADVREIKKVVDIPVFCAGRFDEAELAEAAIAAGEIDGVGLGRALLADPYLPEKWSEGRTGDVRPCISCHQGCFSQILQGKDISCAVNPSCGREKTYALTSAAVKKHVAVIGGGLGGMEAARVCALRGHTVDLYERNGVLGGIFTAAAQPDFKDDDKRLLQWYRQELSRLPVQVHLNCEVTGDMLRQMQYDELILATGARERRLAIPGMESVPADYAVEALMKPDDPAGQNMLIIGGGLTGCEIAYKLAKCGKQVTIVEMTETILNAPGLCAANYNMLMELLDYYHVRVIKNAVVSAFEDGCAVVTETIKNYPNIANRARHHVAIGARGLPRTHRIPTDHVILSVGYLSDQSLCPAEENEHAHLIGDAARPGNIMESIWEAYKIAKDL